VPDVNQSTSEARVEVFMINAKNADFWNHPNMFILENRRGRCIKNEEKKRFFVPKVYKITKMRQFFSQYVRNNFFFFYSSYFSEKMEKTYFSPFTPPHPPHPPNDLKGKYFRQTKLKFIFFLLFC